VAERTGPPRTAATCALAVAAAAWAAPFNETVTRSPQQQAHHEIAILNLLNGLDMDAQQQRALLAVAEKAKAIRDEFRAQDKALFKLFENKLPPSGKCPKCGTAVPGRWA